MYCFQFGSTDITEAQIPNTTQLMNPVKKAVYPWKKLDFVIWIWFFYEKNIKSAHKEKMAWKKPRKNRKVRWFFFPPAKKNKTVLRGKKRYTEFFEKWSEWPSKLFLGKKKTLVFFFFQISGKKKTLLSILSEWVTHKLFREKKTLPLMCLL